ncbi:MAG: 3-isopropylmalate dehydratase small subunit [Gammaproteobacteria bacterium]|nr:MAG: 3-isopropylmalate dehydratase small subunit [Gammaproteobacteria bacterium]
MQRFAQHTGIVVPLDRPNVDTDAIIPKQYLKSIHRTGFGPTLFDEWRYLDAGELGQDHARRELNPKFVLNQSRYAGASILLARDNFGCGSSREHAVWALMDYGIRAVIAPSFADIFFNNAFKNGLLPIVLDSNLIDQLFCETAAIKGYQLSIDLPLQRVITPAEAQLAFAIDDFRKSCLVDGLDDIDLTFAHAEAIRAYEQRRQQDAPWLFLDQDR